MRRKQNCGECKHMRAKIPIRRKVGQSIWDGKLDYQRTQCFCSQGMIQVDQGKKRVDRVFKSFNRDLKTWSQCATGCPAFESMMD